MLSEEITQETASIELAKKLPSLSKHDYSTIDSLMHNVARKHRISHEALSTLFVKRFKKAPHDWLRDKIDEVDEEPTNDLQAEVDRFVEWTTKKLNLKTKPEIELSTDTEEAQDEHHTGSHIEGGNKVWVYVKNRNLVDILRTVAHELTHVRQGELNMIKPGSSYPGSPIELLADMMAGKLIKIYGEANHQIFQ